MIRRTLLALAMMATINACAAEPQAPAKAPAKAPAAAGDAAIRDALATLAPGAEIGSIAPSPIPGLREVAIGSRIVYVSEDGKLLLQGALIDIANRENLTQASEARVRAPLLASIGDDRRIVFPAAQPKHTVTVFTDIDCGYCRRMHQEMAEYNRLGITVQYLFYPRAGLSSESFDKAVSVWCAPDRRKALTEAKAGKELPKANCTNPVARDYELGRRIGLDGTPAVYSADGTQLGGYVPPAEMLERLQEQAGKAGG